MAISRAVSAAVALATAVGALTACGSSSSSGDAHADAGGTTSVKVAVSWSLNGLPVQLAIADGIFAKHGLKVTPVKVQSDAQVVPLLVSNQAQFGQLGTGSTIQSLSKGKSVPIEVTAPNTGSDKPVNGHAFGDIVVPAKSSITSLADLAGKNVAVSGIKTDAWVAARAAIDAAGMDSSKVKFVQIAGPQMVTALSQGQVQAAVLGEPGVTPALKAGAIRILSPVDAGPVGTAASLYLSPSGWANAHSGVVKAFRDSIEEAAKLANTNKAEAVKVAAGYTGVPAAILKDASFPLYSTQLTAQQMQWPIDEAVKYGLVDKSHAPDGATLVAGLG